ncbi:DUF5372 family protein [Paractinoplanes rishiriensis]|uniref:DUF5372 family protein n=1 Tax=Paractinoplanes rishiriensis TaxID=1050105 RepID=UPI0023B2EA4A|nr:DUF5372 family protein [Actinoplanes rishiriensis]
MITHPFHPLKGQRLAVLFSQRKRTGLFFVCEVEGRWRVTVAQEWTDRGVPASADRLAVDGLTAARSLVDAIDPSAAPVEADGVRDSGGDRRESGADVGVGSSPGGDGGGEHGRVVAARQRPGRR